MEMYFIAIVLPEELDSKVREYKEYMKEKWACQTGLRSPAHITLIPPFRMREEQEEPLMNDLAGLAARFSPFVVHTRNFSAFKPRTLFIDLEENEALRRLHEQMMNFFRSKPEYLMKFDDRPFHPHITIANRDLSKKAFREEWPYFSERKFEEEFLAEGISLLKHNGTCWEVRDVVKTGNHGGQGE